MCSHSLAADLYEDIDDTPYESDEEYLSSKRNLKKKKATKPVQLGGKGGYENFGGKFDFSTVSFGNQGQVEFKAGKLPSGKSPASNAGSAMAGEQNRIHTGHNVNYRGEHGTPTDAAAVGDTGYAPGIVDYATQYRGGYDPAPAGDTPGVVQAIDPYLDGNCKFFRVAIDGRGTEKGLQIDNATGNLNGRISASGTLDHGSKIWHSIETKNEPVGELKKDKTLAEHLATSNFAPMPIYQESVFDFSEAGNNAFLAAYSAPLQDPSFAAVDDAASLVNPGTGFHPAHNLKRGHVDQRAIVPGFEPAGQYGGLPDLTDLPALAPMPEITAFPDLPAGAFFDNAMYSTSFDNVHLTAEDFTNTELDNAFTGISNDLFGANGLEYPLATDFAGE